MVVKCMPSVSCKLSGPTWVTFSEIFDLLSSFAYVLLEGIVSDPQVGEKSEVQD